MAPGFVQGNLAILKQLASLMVDFDPRFEIMPGTANRGSKVPHVSAFQVEGETNLDPFQGVSAEFVADAE